MEFALKNDVYISQSIAQSIAQSTMIIDVPEDFKPKAWQATLY
jgi:hypothetical protein